MSATLQQTDSQQFVATKAIQEAVKGRELEVLSAIGIAWTGRGSHIACPYADHGGANDWRWDANAGCAFCTCIGNRRPEKGSHSIFDVVACKQNISFEDAKIRVAEIIGRGDLIKTKGSPGGSLKMTAAALMSAPADRRDDTIPKRYLACRLGIEASDVLMPTTPVVGLKALAYFDPAPTGSKEKTVKIGEFPCAVFGTAGADGKTHAHRIYLAPDGTGKARLGIGPDGKERDPKKSATRIGDDKTIGRSVLWGDPDRASHLVLHEGIETAAASAHSLRGLIEAGEIYVASAISAGGIEAFQPYPATTHVTIAADRDEALKNGKKASHRGAIAARKFATAHPELRVDIAMPGKPGESIDWLDVFRRDGTQAVRDGILGAEPFVPSKEDVRQHDDEVAQQERDTRSADEIARIAATYPLPEMDAVTLEYAVTKANQIMVHYTVANKDRRVGCTPFGVPARLRFIDDQDAAGLRVHVQDMSGACRSVDLERGKLPRSSGVEALEALFREGLRTENDGQNVVINALKAAAPKREILIVRRPGWHRVEGHPHPIFMLPSGEAVGAPDGLNLELNSFTKIPPDIAIGGNIQGWRETIDRVASLNNVAHWVLSIAAGFAGALVDLTGLDTCGINLSGKTSLGKTTAEKLAVFAWSLPDLTRNGSLLQSARTTDNSAETKAQKSTGTIFALDELAHISGKDLAKLIYMLSGGVGKGRLTPSLASRNSFSWKTFVTMSCETTLEEKINGDDGRWTGGQAVRILDVDCSGVNARVDLSTRLSIEDGLRKHFGHAGPAFVRALVETGLHEDPSELRDRITKCAQDIVNHKDDKTDPTDHNEPGSLQRAATPLAAIMIAGELAKEFGLIPDTLQVVEAVHWAWKVFRTSTGADVLLPEDRAINNIGEWVLRNWGVSIKSATPGVGSNSRDTLGWFDDDAVYLPKEQLLKASQAENLGIKEAAIGRLLHERKLLHKQDAGDRFTLKWVPHVGKATVYALKRSEFGYGKQAEPAIDMAVNGSDPHTNISSFPRTRREREYV